MELGEGRFHFLTLLALAHSVVNPKPNPSQNIHALTQLPYPTLVTYLGLQLLGHGVA